MITGIYKIVNIVNGKVYIGSSIDIYSRWVFHKQGLRKNNHKNKHLRLAWNKYGEENFKFEILEICDKSKLVEREQIWINFYKPEYNIYKVAYSPLGYKHDQEAFNKMKAYKRTKEHAAKLGQI